ncbi:Gfo/Idh/MocA family oxidoreductase [bacterium]|nr:Gfo/Idh/MocA family oxidoreductase [bacterium]
MDKKPSRRSFFGKAAAAGGAVITGAHSARAIPRTSTPTVELIKVGAVALGDNSHMSYQFSIWPPIINPVEPDKWPTRTTRMIITHCWDSRKEVADAFAQKYKCEAVKNYYDMVDKVDGMIFGGFNEAKWWPQLTKPYLEAGIPCYINRPLAYSMKDANTIIDMARKHNTPILCTEGRETFKEAIVGRCKVQDLLREGKVIIGANSSNAAGEYPQHAIHGLVFLLAIFGLDVEQVSYQADGWWRDVTPVSPHPQQYGLLTLQYRGINIPGAGEQKTPFIVSQQQFSEYIKSDNTLRIFYSGGWWDLDQHNPEGEHMNRLNSLFYPTIFAIQRLFESRTMPWSYEYILKKNKIFLAGFKSHLEHKGALTRVDDLSDDWEAPNPYADWIDESIFK